MISEIQIESKRRGITRLCHFTPSRNLVHIASDSVGILATKKLQEDERRVFTATDLERLDRHEGFISCSIEYPNAWYFDQARGRDQIFKDWVVLFISPAYLWSPGTRFCPRNAAAEGGRCVADGKDAFESLFANSITGAGGRTFSRLSLHLPCCATDDQAEILVPDHILKGDILGIAVASETQAKNEISRLFYAGNAVDVFNFFIAPDLFNKRVLSNLIRSNRRPKEVAWYPENRHD